MGSYGMRKARKKALLNYYTKQLGKRGVAAALEAYKMAGGFTDNRTYAFWRMTETIHNVVRTVKSENGTTYVINPRKQWNVAPIGARGPKGRNPETLSKGQSYGHNAGQVVTQRDVNGKAVTSRLGLPRVGTVTSKYNPRESGRLGGKKNEFDTQQLTRGNKKLPSGMQTRSEKTGRGPKPNANLAKPNKKTGKGGKKK